MDFIASESGTYYIAAGAYGRRQGTYEVEVTDTSPPESSQQQSAQQNPVDADATRGGATDLGDITDRAGPRFPDASLDGDGDRVDYLRFILTEAKEVALGLRRQFAIRANGGHTMKATYALFAGMLLCLATQAQALPQQIIDVGMTVGNNFGLNMEWAPGAHSITTL